MRKFPRGWPPLNRSGQNTCDGLKSEVRAQEVLAATKAIRRLLTTYTAGWDEATAIDLIRREITKIRDSRLPLFDNVAELESWIAILFSVRAHQAYGGKYRVKHLTLRSLSSIEIKAACYRDLIRGAME